MNKLLLGAAIIICIIVAGGALYLNKGDNMQNFAKTDADFNAMWNHFLENDVKPHGKLDTQMRYLTVLAAHVATQSVNEYKLILAQALDDKVSPIAIKEMLYQTVPYAGMAKAYDFFDATNEVMSAKGVKLPLPSQAVTTPDNRLEKGLDTQCAIFGKEQILSMRKNAPDDLKHIQDYLSANCFGDYYTRNGLNIQQRELITFAVLISMGGADAQAKAHAQANVNVGNDRQVLLDVISGLLPYIGYPRSLNGIAAVDTVTKE